jgi:hypothetical protein
MHADFKGRGTLQKINVDKYAVARYYYKKNGS